MLRKALNKEEGLVLDAENYEISAENIYNSAYDAVLVPFLVNSEKYFSYFFWNFEIFSQIFDKI